MSGDGQLELSFDEAGAPAGEGLAAWHAEQAQAAEVLCQRLGLPLGHEAEVRLVQGPWLRGVLRMAEAARWVGAERDRLAFRIGATTFRLAEIESAVRVEG